MDPRAEGSLFRNLPRALINKRGEAILIHHLDDKTAARLIEMYLAFRPRPSFQGLPPIKDETCRKWVQGMIANGINLVALSFEAGVVGHCALFPMEQGMCEMLIVVSPPLQNTGIGTELARSIVELAYEKGFERIWLPVESTNVRARHVYKKCGFDYLPGKPSRELEMTLDLKRYHGVVDVCVEAIMSHEAITIGPDDSCRKALSEMLDRHVSSLPVVDGEGVLLGLLSQTDLMQPLNVDKQVSDLFSRHVPTVQPGHNVGKLVRMFQSGRVRCIPVVNDRKRLVGIVGRREILSYYARRLY